MGTAARRRLKLVAELSELPPDETWPARSATADDGQALARLMLAAYAGTIDDGGETFEDALAEVGRTVGGAYGPYQAGCSFLVAAGEQAVAASLISLWDDEPLVAFVMVAPAHQGRGLGRFVLERSMGALAAQGYRRLSLYVTDGNTPAQRLYARLGFTVADDTP